MFRFVHSTFFGAIGLWVVGGISLSFAVDTMSIERAEALSREIHETYRERATDSSRYNDILAEFARVLLAPSEGNSPVTEMIRTEFRQAWANVYIAQRLQDCTRGYVNVLQARNDWKDEDIPDGVKALLSSRLGLHSKMLREVGWVNDIHDIYIPLAHRFGRRPVEISLDWLDPSGFLRGDIQRRCEQTRSALLVLEERKNFSAWREAVRYTFDRSAQKEEHHVEFALMEFGSGLKDGVVFALKDLPRSLYYGVKGRLQTVQGWITADELTYELTRQVYAERWEKAQDFVKDPSGKIVETTDDMGELFLQLTPRDIGAITAGVEIAILSDRAFRAFAGSSLANTPVSRSGKAMRAEIAHLNQRLIMDPLSRVYNKAALFADRNELGPVGLRIQKMMGEGKKVSALYVDGDFFKAFNDLLSHSAGDDLIRTFASEARKVAASIRNKDMVFRMGGEEFVVILPDTPLKQAVLAAERLQTNVKTSQMRVRLNRLVHERALELQARQAVDGRARETLEAAFRGLGRYPENGNVGTLSIGVAESKRGESLMELINGADEALKMAKSNPGKQGIATRTWAKGRDIHVIVNGTK